MILQVLQSFLTDERTFIAWYPGEHVLFVPVGDSSLRQVVGGEFHRYFVAHKNLDEIHSHFAGNMGEHVVPILQCYLEHCVGQRLGNHAVDFYGTLFRHSKLLPCTLRQNLRFTLSHDDGVLEMG